MKSKSTLTILCALFAFFQHTSAQPVQLNEQFHQLNNLLNDSIPPGNFDQSYLDELASGLDTLSQHLPGTGLSGANQDTLLDVFNWLFDVLNNNQDSLDGIFGNYHDSLAFDYPNWNVTVAGFDSLAESEQNELETIYQDNYGDPANPKVPDSLGEVINKLFDVNLFPDIELAFGTQTAVLDYWGLKYQKNARVIRVGSVPRFNREAYQNTDFSSPTLPIEARWHAEASWFNSSIPNGSGDTNTPSDSDPSFNPLLFFGDYALMATPHVGKLGSTSFRFLASFGTEFGTYAPAHQDFNRPFTSFNKGYTTGVGAQTGAGFAFTNGQLTVYSLATYTHGRTINSALPYHYDNTRYEVGMRYGKIVNVRFSSGITSWQSFGNREARVKNQITVGLILSQLH